MTRNMKPILLLHGAWCGAWVWSTTIPTLVQAGHPVIAVDLPGHGLNAVVPEGYDAQDLDVLTQSASACASLDSASLADAAEAPIRMLYEVYGPVSVVGHSLAGTCVSILGERMPEMIGDLVYFAALAPLAGGSVADRLGAESFGRSLFPALPIADPTVLGATRLNFGSLDERYQKTMFECLYDPSVEPGDTRGAAHLLTPDTPWRMYSDTVDLTADRWGSVARSWIRATNDLAVPIEYQDETIALLDAAFPENPFTRVSLNTGHMAMLSAPARAASAILEAITESSQQ